MMLTIAEKGRDEVGEEVFVADDGPARGFRRLSLDSNSFLEALMPIFAVSRSCKSQDI